MGFAKQNELSYYSKGLKTPKQTLVCNHHIDDYAIKKFVSSNGMSGTCSYCRRRKKTVVEFGSLLKHISSGLFYFYDDAGNSMFYDSEEGGYHGAPTFYIGELLDDEIGLEVDNNELKKDIHTAFDDSITWCKKDPYANREHEELYYSWSNFKDIIKYQNRYFFSQTSKAYEILKYTAQIIDSLNLFRFIEPDMKLFRCRQHEPKETIIRAQQIASPPFDKAIYSNRMSPAGISMFYCSFNSHSAYLETIDIHDTKRTQITTAVFTNKERLYLLDFTKIPSLPSVFDTERRKDYSSILFLKGFIHDLSMDIKRDGKEHVEYIPTQIVTEYFRYAYSGMTEVKIDGIIYPSAKIKGGTSCVLFMDHKESLNKLNLDIASLHTKNIT